MINFKMLPSSNSIINLQVTTNDCKWVDAECDVRNGQNYVRSKQQDEKPELSRNDEKINELKRKNEHNERIRSRHHGKWLSWYLRLRRGQVNKQYDKWRSVKTEEKSLNGPRRLREPVKRYLINESMMLRCTCTIQYVGGMINY